MTKKNQTRLWIIVGLIIIILIALVAVSYVPEDGGDTLRIGALLPLSGKNAVYGIEIQNAIELAREEINSAGGINGKSLEVVYEDDQADPALGTIGMQKLVNVDQVPVVLGSWASGVVVATAPIAEQNHVIVMAVAISPSITDAGDYIFRTEPSATFYIAKSVELLKNLNISTAAVIFVNNEFGRALKDVFISDFESMGGEVLTIEAYAQGDTDFRSQLLKIKSTNPELIFIPGYQDTIDVIKQIKELGIESRILASPTFESKSSIEKLGEIAEEVIYPYHFVAGRGDPKAQHYEQAYLAKYGIPTGGFAPITYDATYIIANALKKCEKDTECIKQELYATEYYGVIGKITFDEKGDPYVPIIMKTVRNGEFVAYEE